MKRGKKLSLAEILTCLLIAKALIEIYILIN